MSETVTVIDYQRSGRKGFPLHAKAYPKFALPMKEVPIDSGEPLLPVEELTPEQRRYLMPRKSMVQFRSDLRNIKVVEHLDVDGVPYLDGIYEEDILAKIDLIADKALRAEARDYFIYAEYIERVNPWVDILGAMFGLTPEEIDVHWMA